MPANGSDTSQPTGFHMNQGSPISAIRKPSSRNPVTKIPFSSISDTRSVI